MITFVIGGSTQKTEAFLKAMSKMDVMGLLNTYGQEGVTALATATPRDSGLAAASWSYEVRKTAIVWLNSDVESGFPVAIMLQYGYGTGTGGYVAGVDYINPAIRPIFDKIAEKVWKAVTSA